jgi:surfeit locus 1 family protein
MEYRSVGVTGVYDHSQEVLLRNQAWENQPGYRVLTPLLIDGSEQAVLVDRGWIPFDGTDDLSLYQEPGRVEINGMIRRPQTRPEIGGVLDPTLAPGQTRLTAFNIVNIERLQEQVDGSLLPVYIQQAPDPSHSQLPYRSLPEIEITAGPHFGYALQWFAFAALLGFGYPFFAYRQIKGS